MTNPFRFGEAVSGPCFANRKKEIADIEEHIRSGQNVFIYSYRRLGKTSLIMKILDRLSKRKEALTI